MTQLSRIFAASIDTRLKGDAARAEMELKTLFYCTVRKCFSDESERDTQSLFRLLSGKTT